MARGGADDTWLIDVLVPVVVVVVAVAVASVGFAVARLAGPARRVSPPGARPLRRFLRVHPAVRRRFDPTEITGLLLTVALAVLIGAGVAFGALMEMVTSERGLYRFDAGVAEWGAERATPRTTELLRGATQLGSTVVLGAAAAVVGVAAYARRGEARVGAFLAVVFAGQNLLANGVKVLVGRDRPAVLPLVDATGLSFPSGHATAAAATVTAIAFVLGRRRGRLVKVLLGLGAAVVVVVVAATRVLLGVHWLTDVIAGAVLGLGWFAVCAIAFGGRLLRFGASAEPAP